MIIPTSRFYLFPIFFKFQFVDTKVSVLVFLPEFFRFNNYLYVCSGHNGNGILTPDEDHGEDGRSGEEEVIEIEETNSSVIGERRPESSLKSEVSAFCLPTR